jgi:hypothetical protein
MFIESKTTRHYMKSVFNFWFDGNNKTCVRTDQ